MINIEKLKKVLESENFLEIEKEVKITYKSVFSQNDYLKLYNEIFVNIDFNTIKKSPILYMFYCKVLLNNNKILELKDIFLEKNNFIEQDKSINFESNLLFIEACLENYNSNLYLAIEKLEIALEKLSNKYDYNLMVEIYYELAGIYLSSYKINNSIVSFKKAESYIIKDSVDSKKVLFRIKINLAKLQIRKNKLNEAFSEISKLNKIIDFNLLSNAQIIFYYEVLASFYFYKNKKQELNELFDKFMFIFENSIDSPSFMPYMRIAKYLLAFNEIEKCKQTIDNIELKFNFSIPRINIRFFAYILNISFYKKTNDKELYITWLNELGKEIKENFSKNYGITILYADLLLENDDIDKVELIFAEISPLIKKIDSELLNLRLNLLETALIYKKGYKNRAILDLKEILILCQKEWNVGIFLDSSDIIINMVNEIYKESLNKENLLNSNFLKEIVSYSNEKFNFDNYLTEKEIEVLKLVAQKKSNKEIANSLFLSVNTIKTHLKNISKKLDVNNKNDAVLKAKEHFLI
ncbi:MAG: LuxR C-terminal-related transcriptional regulator [Candidatus Sericytochromatia bacterium]